MKFLITSTGNHFDDYERDFDSLDSLMLYIGNLDSSVIIHFDDNDSLCIPEIEVYDDYRE